MITAEDKRLFCEALGLRVDVVKVERIPHPTKRAHMLYRVWHPAFGEGVDALEHRAWEKFMDVAEKAPPLPSRCEGVTKSGERCRSAPQAGERLCGPHLTKARGG